MKGSGIMVSFLLVIVSSFFLNATQSFNNQNGWASLSAASSHCPCCKGPCHCGMEKSKTGELSHATKNNSEKAPCCAKKDRLPSSNTNDHSFIAVSTNFKELNKVFSEGAFEYSTVCNEKISGHLYIVSSAHSLSPPASQTIFPLRV